MQPPPEGEVVRFDVVQGSGWKSIDSAGYEVFKYARLRPLPPVAPAADVYLRFDLRLRGIWYGWDWLQYL